MESSRGTVILALAVAACCAAPAPASGTDGVDSSRCVARAMQWIQPGHKVMLICRDGSRQAGRIAAFDSTRGTLQFAPVAGGAAYDLPAAAVARLEWRERATPSPVVALLGLAVGSIIGVAIALPASSDNHSISLDTALLITSLGAALGVVGTVEASVALSEPNYYATDCRGGPENLPTRRPARAVRLR